MIPLVSLRQHTWRQRVLSVLKSGGVVVYPTDTIYGIGCDALNEKALARVMRIKKRKDAKPFPVLAAHVAMAQRFAKIPDWFLPLLPCVWPGAWTLVLPAKRRLPKAIAARGTVGIRIPDYAALRVLLSDFGMPLVGTSANVSGSRPARSAKEAARIFGSEKEKPDLILDGGRLSGKPSRVIRLTSRGLTIIR